MHCHNILYTMNTLLHWDIYLEQDFYLEQELLLQAVCTASSTPSVIQSIWQSAEKNGK